LCAPPQTWLKKHEHRPNKVAIAVHSSLFYEGNPVLATE